jgi:polyisoprenoid-binding protein YceI
LLLALAIGALASALPARAGEPGPGDFPKGVYLLEPQHSRFVASLRFLGVSRYPVSFSGITGRMEASKQAASVPRVTIRVDPRSISNPRSAVARSMLTLLEPERFPQIAFASRQLGNSNGQMWLLGDLTLHGVTRPVRLTLQFKPMEQRPDGPAGFSVHGRGRIRRSDFGMPQMHTLVGDQVDLTFQAEFVQAPAQAGVRQARGGAPNETAYDPGGSDDLE